MRLQLQDEEADAARTAGWAVISLWHLVSIPSTAAVLIFARNRTSILMLECFEIRWERRPAGRQLL